MLKGFSISLLLSEVQAKSFDWVKKHTSTSHQRARHFRCRANERVNRLIWYKGQEQNIGETTEIKGFRYIGCDRKPLLLCWLYQERERSVFRFVPPFADLNSPSMSNLNPLKVKSKCIKRLQIFQFLLQLLEKSIGGFWKNLVFFPYNAKFCFQSRKKRFKTQVAVIGCIDELI